MDVCTFIKSGYNYNFILSNTSTFITTYTPPAPIIIDLTGDETPKGDLTPTIKLSPSSSVDSDKTVQFEKYFKKPEDITIKTDNDNNNWS